MSSERKGTSSRDRSTQLTIPPHVCSSLPAQQDSMATPHVVRRDPTKGSVYSVTAPSPIEKALLRFILPAQRPEKIAFRASGIFFDRRILEKRGKREKLERSRVIRDNGLIWVIKCI